MNADQALNHLEEQFGHHTAHLSTCEQHMVATRLIRSLLETVEDLNDDMYRTCQHSNAEPGMWCIDCGQTKPDASTSAKKPSCSCPTGMPLSRDCQVDHFSAETPEENPRLRPIGFCPECLMAGGAHKLRCSKAPTLAEPKPEPKCTCTPIPLHDLACAIHKGKFDEAVQNRLSNQIKPLI